LSYDEDDEKYTFLYCLQIGYNDFEDKINKKIEKAKNRKTQQLQRTFHYHPKVFEIFKNSLIKLWYRCL
jgi:hypothetical protein